MGLLSDNDQALGPWRLNSSRDNVQVNVQDGGSGQNSEDQMNVCQLPLELIDQILKRLDAISLAKSRQVCRSWRALHAQPEYKLVWRRACLRDIGRDILIELTGNSNVFGNEDVSKSSSNKKEVKWESESVDWEGIYREWYRSRHIGKWPCMTTELKGHQGPVWDVKTSGDRLVTCGEDGTIRIWDSWTSHCIRILLAHCRAVVSISLRKTPGSLPHADIPHDLLVSGSKDCSVKVWDLQTPGSALFTMHGHIACINCVAVESNLAASASDDCSIRVWDITTGHCCHVLSNLGDWVKYVRFWTQETLLLVTDTCHLALWSVNHWKPLSSITLQDTMTPNSRPLTPGVQGAVLRGETALILTHSHGLFAWDNISDGGISHNVSLIGERGECLAMHGALVAVGKRSGVVNVYHLDGDWKDQFDKEHCVLRTSHSPINAVVVDDDGEGPVLVTAGDDGIIRVHRWFPPSIQDSQPKGT